MPRIIFVLAVIGLLGTSIQPSSTKHNNPYGIYKEVKVPWTVWTATAEPYREHQGGNSYEKPTNAPTTLNSEEPCESDNYHQTQPPPPPTVHDDDVNENININSNLNVNENALEDVVVNANKEEEAAQNDNQNPFLCELLFGKKTHICLH